MTTSIAPPGPHENASDVPVVGPTQWQDPWKITSAVVAAVMVVLVIWPIFEAGRAALDLVWHPSGDWAVLTLRVEDVGRSTPLVGPYSRFGWNHPGPLMYWLLSVPYHVFGSRPEALLTAAAFLNGMTVAAIGAVAWRRGRLPLVAVTMTGLAILIHAMGPTMIRDPWNPYITLLPLALFVFLAWSIAEGDWWMWPALLFVMSFQLQSHVGYVPMLAVVGVTALVIAWRRRRSVPLLPPDRRSRRIMVITSIAVLVLCWIPVFVDQVSGSGNLLEIFRYFLSPGDRPAGTGTALSQMARQLTWPDAPWLGHKELAAPDGALLGTDAIALVIPFLAMAIAALAAWRTGARSALRLQILAVALAASGFLANAQVVGPIFDWIVRWWWVIACLWWTSIVWALWSTFVMVFEGREVRHTATVIIVALGALFTLHAVRPVVTAAKSAIPPNPSASAVLGLLVPPTIDALSGSGPVLVESTGSVRGDYADAVRLQLERNGIEVAASSDMEYRLGPQRSIGNRPPAATVWIVNADAISAFRQMPEMTFVAMWDPLDPAQREAYFVAEHQLQEQLTAAGRPDLAVALTNGTGNVDTEGTTLAGVDQELLSRVETTRRQGDPVAIFIGPPPLAR